MPIFFIILFLIALIVTFYFVNQKKERKKLPDDPTYIEPFLEEDGDKKDLKK